MSLNGEFYKFDITNNEIESYCNIIKNIFLLTIFTISFILVSLVFYIQPIFIPIFIGVSILLSYINKRMSKMSINS